MKIFWYKISPPPANDGKRLNLREVLWSSVFRWRVERRLALKTAADHSRVAPNPERIKPSHGNCNGSQNNNTKAWRPRQATNESTKGPHYSPTLDQLSCGTGNDLSCMLMVWLHAEEKTDFSFLRVLGIWCMFNPRLLCPVYYPQGILEDTELFTKELFLN